MSKEKVVFMGEAISRSANAAKKTTKTGKDMRQTVEQAVKKFFEENLEELATIVARSAISEEIQRQLNESFSFEETAQKIEELSLFAKESVESEKRLQTQIEEIRGQMSKLDELFASIVKDMKKAKKEDKE